MKLEHEFYKLPLLFDIEPLKQEISRFAESDWQKHPSDYKGNLAIPLISANGEINDRFAGQMLMTRFLKQSPCIQQVIATFKSVIGRSRLMRLEGQHEVPLHSDINYHWYSRVRIHIPIVTTPDVIFHCGDQQVHMAPGEAWIFDAWKMHKVVNPSGSTRVHLVIDTAGSPEFWELADRAEKVSSSHVEPVDFDPLEVQLIPNRTVEIQTEKFNVPLVMSAGEVNALVQDLVEDVIAAKMNPAGLVKQYIRTANSFRYAWQSIWAQHAQNRGGWSAYQRLIDDTKKMLSTFTPPSLTNRADASQVLAARVLDSAFHPELEPIYTSKSNAKVSRVSPSRAQTLNTVTPTDPTTVGRNAPCPCGSGKKYKRCHGR